MSNYIVSNYDRYNSQYNSQYNSHNNICFDMKIGDLFMNNTIIQMLNMLQTIISSLPMNTTNINNLEANSMIIKNLSLVNLVIELVPAYWLVVILALTAICLFLGTIMLFIKLSFMYKKYRNTYKYNNLNQPLNESLNSDSQNPN